MYCHGNLGLTFSKFNASAKVRGKYLLQATAIKINELIFYIIITLNILLNIKYQ